MQHSSLESFFAEIENITTSDLRQILEKYKHLFSWKGYGTPELEIKLLHQIFCSIQDRHPEFKSFAFSQCNGYNDNYYHFQLKYFTINDSLHCNTDINFYFHYHTSDFISNRIRFDSIEDHDPDYYEFAKSKNITYENTIEWSNQYFDEFLEYQKEKYKSLEIPSLKFLLLLKILEVYFSMYYFLYVFGNGVDVRFDREGVSITKQDINEMDGNPLGDGMKFIENL